MVQIHTVQPKTPRTKKPRIGRGGKRGTYSGRGTKGQLARSGRKLRPELRDTIKKIPKLRGRGKNIFTSTEVKPYPVNIGSIESAFEAGSTITSGVLLEKGLVRRVGGKTPAIKILGAGALSKKFTFSKGFSFSAGAKAAVEKAGGSIAA